MTFAEFFKFISDSGPASIAGIMAYMWHLARKQADEERQRADAATAKCQLLAEEHSKIFQELYTKSQGGS